jgi:glycosyltransferase involved in cell wall biosynthesis
VRPLLVDLEPAWRGGQNQALLLLKGLRELGHAPELVAAHDSALGERAATAKIPVHYVSRGFFRLPAAQKIRRLLSDTSARPYDLIHANEAHAVSAAWLARAHQRIPFVISRRVGYPLGKSALARARYHAAARIVANSQWVADQAASSGAPREKITVIYEGAEIPPRFTPQQRTAARARWNISDGTPLLGCVGVLLPDKGQEWLIRALAEIRRDPTASNAKLLLAGDGPSRSQLESLARELHVTDAVIFAGFVKHVENVYAALDVFLLPSFFEALNNSLLAAMAYEIPSISYRRGALGEVIEDGQSGLLVEAANTPAMCAAISRILRDPPAAKKMAEAAHLRIQQNFSAQKMVAATLVLYESLLRRPPPPNV